MINLKRDSNGNAVPATGVRTRTSSMYSPGQTEPFRISRSKFNDFLTCQRCFYLDRVKGLVSPGMPGWSLNETTDLLLKKEFDQCREKQIPHRLFEQYGLTHVVPLQHPDIDHWRNSLRGGIEYHVPETNIVLHGGIDDVWYDTSVEQLIVLDYKSQATRYPVRTKSYLSGVYHQSYKIQLDVYAYLFINMGFAVSSTGYFYVCNADRNALEFAGRLDFEETLVPYELDSSWVESKVLKMASVLNSNKLPSENPACENCAYARQRALITNE